MLEDQTSNIALEQKPIAVSLPSRSEVKKLYQTIVDAERPLVIAGGQLGTESGKKLLREFAEKFDVPVAVAWRRQDLFDHLHPYFASHLAFNLPPIYRDTLNEADLILFVVDGRNDITSTDRLLAEAIIKSNKPCILVINKVDTLKSEESGQ